jgi:K+-transporting ATPase ATPase A chain
LPLHLRHFAAAKSSAAESAGLWRALTPDLAFNTAISFTTNTNWQSYSGESTMSYLSQMVALVIHNFASAATGIAIAAALVRGLARHSTTPARQFLGGSGPRHLLSAAAHLPGVCCRPRFPAGHDSKFQALHQRQTPGAIHHQVQKTDAKGQPVTTNLAVTVPQLDAKGQPAEQRRGGGSALDAKGQPVMTNVPVMVNQTVDQQAIVQGPMASQVAIKMLGTNGGGNANANAAYPFENPTPLSNFLQMLSIFAIGSGLTWYLGRMTGNQAHGWAVWATMMILFLAGVLLAWHSPRPPAIPFTSNWGWPWRMATWRARKSASASSIPPCSPPSPPTLPAVR